MPIPPLSRCHIHRACLPKDRPQHRRRPLPHLPRPFYPPTPPPWRLPPALLPPSLLSPHCHHASPCADSWTGGPSSLGTLKLAPACPEMAPRGGTPPRRYRWRGYRSATTSFASPGRQGQNRQTAPGTFATRRCGLPKVRAPPGAPCGCGTSLPAHLRHLRRIAPAPPSPD